MKLKKLLGKFVSVAVVFVFVVSAYAQNQTVTVTGNTSPAENQPGWMFNRDLSNATPIDFNTDQASIGFGSLYVEPIGSIPAHKFIGENFINMAIADIDSISYDFLIGSGGDASDADQFYMNVYANFGVSDNLKFYDCRYEVIPTVGSTTGFTTVTFDPTQAYPVTTRTGGSASPYPCPAIPADMDLISSGSNIRMFSINVGDTTASDAGLDGYYDKVVVSTTGGSTTYDFEPVLTPTSKDQCKNGGWMNFNTPVFKNQGDCIRYANTGK
jgi:hypothetical protein